MLQEFFRRCLLDAVAWSIVGQHREELTGMAVQKLNVFH